MNVNELAGVMSREELLEKVAPYESTVVENTDVGGHVEFNVTPENNIVFNCRSGEYILSEAALGTLLAQIGFPRTYLRRVPRERNRDLVVPHLNYWYRENSGGEMIRLFVRENRVTQIVPKADFEHISISDILEVIEAQLGDEVAGFHKFREYDGDVSFSVLTPREVEIGGDTFNEGIRIEHSILGRTSTRVSAYLFRQICSNGATTEEQLGGWRRRRNSGDDFGTWLQKVLIDAHASFEKEVNRVAALREIPTNDHTSEILSSVLRSSAVPRKLQDEVRNALIDREVETLYDIYNILTEVDTHSSYFLERPSSAGALDKVARHLSFNSRLCPVCHRQMEGSAN